jgi:hypothetical protein
MDDTPSGGTLTAPAPSNPALEAAQAELTDIATNPSNPRYAGYKRGDKQVLSHLEQLYQKACPPGIAPSPIGDETAPLVPREGLSLTTDLTGSGRYEQAQAEALTALQQEYGADFTSNLMPEDPAAVRANLQREWGPDFESRWAGVENVATHLLHHNPRLYFEAAAVLGDARGLRLLDAIRQTMAAYRR